MVSYIFIVNWLEIVVESARYYFLRAPGGGLRKLFKSTQGGSIRINHCVTICKGLKIFY